MKLERRIGNKEDKFSDKISLYWEMEKDPCSHFIQHFIENINRGLPYLRKLKAYSNITQYS